MKKLFLLFFALSVCSSWAQCTSPCVAQALTNTSSGGGGPITATINSTGANFIVVSLAYAQGFVGTISITDTVTGFTASGSPATVNTYSGTLDEPSVLPKAGIYFAENAHTGATHVVTITPTGSFFGQAVVTAFAGVAPSSSFDNGGGSGACVSNDSGGAASSIEAAGPCVPTQAGDLVLNTLAVSEFTTTTYLSDTSSGHGSYSYNAINQHVGVSGDAYGVAASYRVQSGSNLEYPRWTASTGTVDMAGTSSIFKMATSGLSVSPTTVIQGTTSTVFLLTGTGTSWTPGVAGSPTFTLSGGTGASISFQSIASTTSATAQIAAGSALGTLTITDPGTSQTATINVVAAVPPARPFIIIQ